MSDLRTALARQTARQEIDLERLRQVREEGWTPEHDDFHEDGQMLDAARCYYQHATIGCAAYLDDGEPIDWPWARRWWKPKGHRRDLVRAGALCMAEQERAGRVGADIRPAAALLEQIVAALSSPLPSEGREQTDMPRICSTCQGGYRCDLCNGASHWAPSHLPTEATDDDIPAFLRRQVL